MGMCRPMQGTYGDMYVVVGIHVGLRAQVLGSLRVSSLGLVRFRV